MEACYGGTDVMERSCAVARGIDINIRGVGGWLKLKLFRALCPEPRGFFLSFGLDYFLVSGVPLLKL
jgi:hypothetical protein